MRLAEFVGRFPGMRVISPEDASPADNRRILEFFDQAPMKTGDFAVQYRRAPDFFRLLRYQADRSYVFLATGPGGSVRAVGTLSLRPGWIDGRATTIGYLGDLRVGFDRRIAAQWRQFYGSLLAEAGEIGELAGVELWLTAILDDNRLARRMFEKPRPDAPLYLPLAPFTMRNLIARWPLPRRRRGGWSVRRAGAADAGPLETFFETAQQGLPAGFRGEFARRLRCWDGLRLEDFALAEDGDGPVACVAPWSPAQAKQTVVSRLPLPLRWLGGLARALPRALSQRSLRVPRDGEALRVAYLTHLAFAPRLSPGGRVEVFRALLDHLFDRWAEHDWHFAALCDFAAWDLGRGLQGYLQQKVPITLYSVLAPGRSPQEAEALRRADPPAFEMALV